MDVVLTALYVVLVHVMLQSGTESKAIFLVAAPSTVRFNTDTTLVVSVSDVSSPTTISLELMDDDRTIWTKRLYFTQDRYMRNVTFNLELGDVNVLSSSVDLSATDGTTYLTESLSLDRASGYIFIQTDKPIYTPQQTVMYRVVALDEDQRWAPWQVRIDIISPESIVLDRMMYTAKDAFSGKKFQLPAEATLGEWKIKASFVTYTQHYPNNNRTDPEDVEPYHDGPDDTRYKAAVHNVTLEDVPVFTKEKIQLHLTVSFGYLLRKLDVDQLHKHFGLNYDQSIRAAVIDTIKGVGVRFSVTEYANSRDSVESEIHKALWNKISGTSCHYNCSVHKYACQMDCKPLCSCDSDDKGFYVDVIGFNLVKVPIPTSVLERFGIPKMKRPVTGKPKSDEPSSYITQITIGKSVTSVFEVKEYELPTFYASLEVSTRVVLRTTRNITVKVLAKYLYEKGIRGHVAMRLGVLRTSDVALFPKVYHKQIHHGVTEIVVNITDLEMTSLWFPSANSRLYIEANVTDESSMETQTIQNQSTVFAEQLYKFTGLDNEQFIPGRDYHFKTKLLYANNDTAAGILVRVEVFSDRRRTPLDVHMKVTSADGDVTFSLQGQLVHGLVITFKVTTEQSGLKEQVSVELKAKKVEEVRLSGWVLSLKVVPSQFSVLVRYSMALRNHTRIYLHILVEAKGKIVYTSSSPMLHHGTHVVKIPGHLAPVLSPSAYVTAFYIVPGTPKIMADYVQLDVPDQCFQELQVLHASFDQRAIHNMKKPASEAEIRLRGTEGMLVGLLAVDKAVYVINSKKSLSRETLFSKLGSHNLGTGEKNSLANVKYQDIFKKAGYVLLTNMEELRKKGNSYVMRSKIQKMTPDIGHFGLVGPFSRVDSRYVPLAARSWDMSPKHFGISEIKNFETIPLPPPRKYFPESWMFQEELFRRKTNTIRVKLPDSITTWVIEAIGVSSNQGVCVSKPLDLITFKPFFVNVWLPYKAIRLEKVNIRFSVFNYQPKNLTVIVTVSTDKEICITDKKFGKKWLKYQTRIAPDSSKGNYFSVIPLKSGLYKVRLVVKGAKHVDVIEKKLYVVSEGKPVKKTLSFTLDPTGRQFRNVSVSRDNVVMEGSTIRNIWDLNKKEQKTLVDLALPAELIPGTDRCDIFAYGDLMADVIFTMLSGHVDLMGSTVYDAQEVLGNLAPVIHAIKYIKLTNLKTQDVEEKGHHFVRNGVARLLKYRKSDGSFCLLNDDLSSTWFTAVVLKTLCQARDIAHVDDGMLNAGFLWLLDHLRADETMEEVNPTSDYFQDSEDGIPNLAAEVFIALMECGFTELPDHQQLQGSLLFYLEDHFGDIVDVLVLAKVAYALYLIESPDLPDVLHMLTNAKKVTTEGLVYWSDQENMEEDMSKPHWYQVGPDEMTIEATSYALLVFLKQTITEVDVDPIAEWLIRQRGTNGAFVGALDTTVATQSLAAYSLSRSMKHIKSDLHCNISTEHSSKYHHVINFSHKNIIVRKSLSDVPTGEHYRFTSSGSGLGELQIEASYNVPVGRNDHCRYNVSVTRRPITLTLDSRIQIRRDPLCKYCGFGCGAAETTRNDGSNNGRTHITFSGACICVQICLRKLDRNTPRGVTVEAGMLSGYIPLHISTEQMSEMTKNRVKSHRYDQFREILVTHFHTVPVNETTCFGFLAKDENVVSRHRPATVTLTEQGKKDASCSLSYDAGGSEVSLPVLCTQPSQYKSRECVCTAGTCGICARTHIHQLSFLKDTVCSADYVYQIQYRHIEQFGPWKRIAAEVLSVNKSGHNKVVPGQYIILNVPTYCRCPAFDLEQPHYMIGRDAPRTKDIEGIELFRYVVDNSSFFGMSRSHGDKHHRKWGGSRTKRRRYSISHSHLRFAIHKDRKNRCPK